MEIRIRELQSRELSVGDIFFDQEKGYFQVVANEIEEKYPYSIISLTNFHLVDSYKSLDRIKFHFEIEEIFPQSELLLTRRK